MCRLKGFVAALIQLNVMSKYHEWCDRGLVSHERLDELSLTVTTIPDYLTRDAYWGLDSAAWIVTAFFLANFIFMTCQYFKELLECVERQLVERQLAVSVVRLRSRRFWSAVVWHRFPWAAERPHNSPHPTPPVDQI